MKLLWFPQMSLKVWRLHFWANLQGSVSDGRKIWLLLEEIEDPKIEVKIHWLSHETPFVGLWLYPGFYARMLWVLHSHEVKR